MRDVELNGTATWIAGSDHEVGPATLDAQAGGYARMELDLDGGTRVEDHAPRYGSPAGQWQGSDGRIHAIPMHNCYAGTAWFFPELALPDLSTPGVEAIDEGTATIQGQRVEHLKILTSPASTPSPQATPSSRLTATDLYLDPSSQLPAFIGYAIHPDRNALIESREILHQDRNRDCPAHCNCNGCSRGAMICGTQ